MKRWCGVTSNMEFKIFLTIEPSTTCVTHSDHHRDSLYQSRHMSPSAQQCQIDVLSVQHRKASPPLFFLSPRSSVARGSRTEMTPVQKKERTRCRTRSPPAPRGEGQLPLTDSFPETQLCCSWKVFL